jgi:hypothetical protein
MITMVIACASPTTISPVRYSGGGSATSSYAMVNVSPLGSAPFNTRVASMTLLVGGDVRRV